MSVGKAAPKAAPKGHVEPATPSSNAGGASPGGRLSRKGSSNLGVLYKGLSMQSLLDLNDVPEFANEPGPGHYFGPGSYGFSALGPQRFSKCPSAPAVGFPRTGWDNWTGVVISKGHSGAFQGRDSPGALYQVPNTLSKKTTKIGTSLRPDLSLSLGIDPHGSPGPGYNLREVPGAALGEAVPPSGRVNKSFGLAQRFSSGSHDSIGPGQYARKDSALNPGNGRSIGTGRGAWEKVCTPGWEEFGKARASPGPGPPLWHDFKTEGTRAATIGRAERFPRAAAESCSPGPAFYDQNERQVSRSRQVLSDARSPRQCTFGKQPSKPRFRPVLAHVTAKRGSWGYH